MLAWTLRRSLRLQAIPHELSNLDPDVLQVFLERPLDAPDLGHLLGTEYVRTEFTAANQNSILTARRNWTGNH